MADPTIPPPPDGFTLDVSPPSAPVSQTLGTPKPKVVLLAPQDVAATPGLNPSHTYQKHPDGSISDLGDNGQGLDPGSVDFQAHEYLTTGQMPALGMGNSNIRKQILDRAAEIAGTKGLTGEAFATQVAHYKAGTNQVKGLESQLGMFKQNEANALLNGQNFLDASKDLPLQTGSPALNSVIQFGQTQIPALPGHDQVANMNAYWRTFNDNYARVVAGSPTGSGVLSDSARHDYQQVMLGNYGYSQKVAAFDAIRKDMANRIAASESAINDAYSNLSKTPGYQVPASLSSAINSAEGQQQPAPLAGHGGASPGAGPANTPQAPDGSPTGGNPASDPSVQNVGGFRDEITQNPKGAQEFHDALYSAAGSGKFKSVADAQQWAADFNKQNGTDFGVADTPKTRAAIANAAAGKPFTVELPQMGQTDALRAQSRIRANQDNPGANAAVAGGLDAVSLGAFRPASAVADAAGDFLTGKPFDYTSNLNADSQYLSNVKDQAPGSYVAGQLAGSLLLPSFGARSVPEFSRLGAAYGGLYGFNSSAGQPLASRGLNALSGAVVGAATPMVLGAAGKAVGAAKNALSTVRGTIPSAELPINPDLLSRAGQQEGVTVNRAMVDPSLTPKTTAVGKTMVGSPILRSGMTQIGNQIDAATQKLGNGGTALEPQEIGEGVRGTGLRYITQTGQQFNRLYGQIRQGIGDTKIPASDLGQQLDGLISDFSETPTNKAKEIAWLKGLKQDYGKDMSIDALRGLRTDIRQQLAKGDLTFGPNEARVSSLADAASQDITKGLTAAGKGDLAARFSEVDGAYRDRMDMIQNVIQKLVGKRGQSLSGEQVFANLKSMAGPRGNASGLTRLAEQMTPEERNDMAATFADALGKNQAGDFSTAFLAKRIAQMPQAMRVAVFGPQGAQSMNNLSMLAKAHAMVSQAIGGSPTGLANDYRGWLTDLALGGGAGLLTENAGKGAIVAAAAGAVKAGRDVMNARMLLNPDIQKWLSAAPATANQRAIDVHFSRLNAIATKNPGIAADIRDLQRAIMSAANNNAPVSGSVAASPDQGPQQQAQPQ